MTIQTIEWNKGYCWFEPPTVEANYLCGDLPPRYPLPTVQGVTKLDDEGFFILRADINHPDPVMVDWLD